MMFILNHECAFWCEQDMEVIIKLYQELKYPCQYKVSLNFGLSDIILMMGGYLCVLDDLTHLKTTMITIWKLQ